MKVVRQRGREGVTSLDQGLSPAYTQQPTSQGMGLGERTNNHRRHIVYRVDAGVPNPLQVEEQYAEISDVRPPHLPQTAAEQDAVVYEQIM